MRLRPLLCVGIILVTGCGAFEAGRLVATGSSRSLRERSADAPPSSPAHPALLILAIDGVDRVLLYDMLEAGELPGLAALLGGSQGPFAHAYFDRTIVATLPSSTLAAWSTAMTGMPPAVHGVTGNEFFIRSERRFAAPAPVSFDDATPVLETYTDDYVNRLVAAPTVYERIRARDPDVLVWVAMHQVSRGADRLLMTRRRVLVDAFQAYAEKAAAQVAADNDARRQFEVLDQEVVQDVIADLDDQVPPPDVLTVYISGTDLFAHVDPSGPDAARRAYLREVLDPLLVDLRAALAKHGALDDRYVVVTSDHGHTEVLHDDVHALGADANGGAAALLRLNGFRLRPPALEVPPDADFQAVLAYGGALAYVYLADRSGCPSAGEVCDWNRPPRYREDVLEVAEAFHRSNRNGADVPQLRGTLDMVLVRRPEPPGAPLHPFEVYVGRHKTQSVEAYLRAHPHPTYVDLPSRLRELAVGPHGDRAGDIILIAHSGDRSDPAQRFYFAAPYHSWHGSPAHRDSDIALIVANPQRSTRSIAEVVQSALGPDPHQQRIADVLVALRFSPPLAPPH